MQVANGVIENGQLVLKDVKQIDQSKLTSDCWLIQFHGLKACESCELRGKKDCGGGATLKQMKNKRRTGKGKKET